MNIFFLCLTLSIAIAETCTRHPVIIIPGIMASMLNAKINIPKNVDFCDRKLDCDRSKDWFTLWLNLLDGIPYVNDCYIAYLTCHYNSTSGRMENVEGVQIEPPRFGSTYAVDTISPSFPLKTFSRAFHEVIKGLQKIGYKDEFDLFSAPYDWRYYHHDEYYEKVKELIIKAYENTGNKVVLVSHSMGGLTTYILLDKLGKEFCDKYIHRWVAMSTPFIGTTIANDVVLAGYNMGYPVSKELIKKAARTFETVAMMGPIGEYWDQNEVLVELANGKKYYPKDQIELFSQLEEMKPFAKEAVENSFAPYLKKYNSQVPHGVEMHCGITSGIETAHKITFKGDTFDSKSTIEFVDGDQEVTLNSLEYCKKMTENFTNLGKYTHQGMLLKKEVIEYVKNLACD
ncbi:lecithin:cholesterol acyltransferase domain containing protein [Entamoeba histolytica HM-1:IMSS-B]|uniref:Lecithin:cholesterol acyltransferase domain-containing protein n=6 Tax=Entamoeba histolytica TaxID=5759 RepID=C4M7V0_ENTH1|nr:lecithin:cholesterol acyltransferase domain-containing protein [Entamoeba histolytica HM-1:IMSS]EMD42595.1 lecithin:cholesterol acyltransferase domain containing protein, putative [Entamoeba histolytica KU27]EMH73301.1 lecithin:cholesterol acyltransferase domain containing protein [Entamoeba histolytica HM-1:IMSS-B]EMS17024.1 lecithin:cholesterol acyltransferase domain containing protein [Entamoeba histolytica HM-3:IMSS]ENY65814.1 lecithin:cholesterol acyltransferase domain containing protei|eukprot:XP_649190.1 lecithin:cholesterol acyltransferase domain-containing protein [Entamoeba histolytica HM-1:IMSS]